jgi:hypothetical protein
VRVHVVCCCCMAVRVCERTCRGCCEWVVEDVAVGLGLVVRVGVIAVVIVSTLAFVGLDDGSLDQTLAGSETGYSPLGNGTL